MPVGPLAITDEISFTLPLSIMKESADMMKTEQTKELYEIYSKMVELGRDGKKAGKGFYDYPKGGKKHIWPGLKALYPSKTDYLDAETIGKRMLHIMALESYRCLEEGVLKSSTDGDVGSLTGFGFPPYTGGVFSYIDYVGIHQFVADCQLFQERFGERFKVPESILKRKEKGEIFYN